MPSSPGAGAPAGPRRLAARVPARLGGDLPLRLLSAAVALPVIIAVILVGQEILVAAAALALGVGYFEFARSMGLGPRDPLTWVGGAGVVSIVAVARTDDVPTTWPLTVAVAALLAVPVVEELVRSHTRGDTAPPPFAEMFRRAGRALLGLLYVGWLGSFIVLVRELPAGDQWLLVAVIAAMATDTGAFVTGRLWGRHALAPRISPKKTVEGALGGWAVGLSAVLLLALLPDLEIAYWKFWPLALILPVLAQIGDLAASLIKRAVDVKDFSHLVPGHGGMLDRLDSILFGAPTVYLFVRWIAL